MFEVDKGAVENDESFVDIGAPLVADDKATDGAHRAIVETGRHRMAALAALGHETAPVWLPSKVVRREEVSAWPGVVAGVFTRKDALAIFGRLFAARQPAALDAACWSVAPEVPP